MKGFSLLLVGVIVGAIVATGAYFLGQRYAGQITNGADEQVAQPTPTPPAPQVAQIGTVEGSLGYPSEGIPEDLQVCAETLMGVQFECTSSHIKDSKYTYGLGYKLELPPGNYYVYAQLPNDAYKAYYSEFVPCGLSINCPSHEPIEVNVSAGETVTGIDPQDWYNQ